MHGVVAATYHYQGEWPADTCSQHWVPTLQQMELFAMSEGQFSPEYSLNPQL